jgi:hypothetical protein
MIRGLEVTLLHCHPAEAELAVTWVPEDPASSGWELRGRLTGPRHAFRETIQIPYPLRPQPRTAEPVRARIVIPDPLLWSPTDPYLYVGPIEVCRDGTVVARCEWSTGLCTTQLQTRKGMRLNGQPLLLSGLACREARLDQAPAWRAAGVNLLLTSLTDANRGLWSAADRLGFFVLGEIDPDLDELLWYAAEVLSQHTCCLGWVLPQELATQPQRWHQVVSLLQAQRPGVFLGLRVATLPLGVVPGHVSFLVGEAELLDALPAQGLPHLPILPRGQQELASSPPEGTLRLGLVRRRLEA